MDRIPRIASILIASVLSLPAFAGPEEKADKSARSCPMLLSAVTLEQYARAVKKSELTAAALLRAQRALEEDFSNLPAWSRSPLSARDLASRVNILLPQFSGAVSAAIRGQDKVSDEWTRRLMITFTGSEVGILHSDLRASVRRAAENPQIYPAFAMAEFIIAKRPSVEALLLRIVRGGSIIGGPRQAEMIRLALQYSLTRPDDHVLEIGYGTPAVLLGFGYYTGIRSLTGVDPSVAPGPSDQRLAQAGVELLRGTFPDSGEAMIRVREKAPYSVIMALDVVKHGPLKTSLTPVAFARALYDLLDRGGTVVLLNDFNEEPYFSRDEARAAGFEIVRWGLDRELAPALKGLMPYSPNDAHAGHLKGFILRKGEPRNDRLRIHAQSVKKSS